MKKTFLFAIVVTSLMVSCGEAEETKNEKPSDKVTQTITEAPVETPVEAPVETPVELAALNDETKKSEGAIECLTQQTALVKQGKLEEALEYYSKKRKGLIIAEITKNPAIKKEWQAAIKKVSEEQMKEWIESVRKDPAFFVFEDGMWKRTDR